MESGEFIRLTYKAHGMGCMVAFMLILPLMVGGGFLSFAIISPTEFHGLLFATWWSPICSLSGLGASMYFLWSAMFNLVGLTEIIATDEDLTIRRNLGPWTSSKSMKLNQILRIIQFKDGGGEEDSFPSWGLRVVGHQKLILLSRQPIEKSDWLGGLLAQHFNVEFSPASIRE